MGAVRVYAGTHGSRHALMHEVANDSGAGQLYLLAQVVCIADLHASQVAVAAHLFNMLQYTVYGTSHSARRCPECELMRHSTGLDGNQQPAPGD